MKDNDTKLLAEAYESMHGMVQRGPEELEGAEQYDEEEFFVITRPAQPGAQSRDEVVRKVIQGGKPAFQKFDGSFVFDSPHLKVNYATPEQIKKYKEHEETWGQALSKHYS